MSGREAVSRTPAEPRPGGRGRPGRSGRQGLLALAVLAVALALIFAGDVVVVGASRLVWEAASPPGLRAYGLAALFTFASALLPFPIEAPALLNGALFPAGRAFLLTWSFAMAGCAASYELGRWLGRAPASRIVGAERMERVERLLERAGWPMLLALRLSPVMAFTALNWASGVLALSRPVFYWTTAAGVVPGTFVFTVTPQLLRERTPTAVLVGFGFAVAVGLLAMSYLRLRRAERPPPP